MRPLADEDVLPADANFITRQLSSWPHAAERAPGTQVYCPCMPLAARTTSDGGLVCRKVLREELFLMCVVWPSEDTLMHLLRPVLSPPLDDMKLHDIGRLVSVRADA